MRTSIRHRLLQSTVRPRSTRRIDQPTESTPTTTFDAPQQEALPDAGRRLFQRGAMPARHGHRVPLSRAPRGVMRRVRRLLPSQQKRQIKLATLRDCGRRCVYCAASLDYEHATLDHVHPLAKGGAHVPGNVVAACPPCNRLKADMLPVEFFTRYPWAGSNFIHHARAVHRALKRQARRAVSLAFAAMPAAA